MLILNKAERRKSEQEEVSDMLCTVWSEISKRKENKGLLLFIEPSLVQKAPITV